MDPEDPYSDPNHFQNSAISSFYLFRHILKISSKSVHKFLIYLVHKHIWQPGSRWSRQWSRSLPKSNHLFLAPFRSFAENVITIHPQLFEVSVFKNYISWIQKIHIVIRITSKIQSFHPFTFSDISWKFHQNPSISFWFILYTNTSGSLDPDDPDHSQNLITCSLSHLGHFLKISSKSTHDFLSYLSLKIIFHGSRRSR